MSTGIHVSAGVHTNAGICVSAGIRIKVGNESVRKASPSALDACFIQYFNDRDIVRFDAASISFFVYLVSFHIFTLFSPLSFIAITTSHRSFV